MHLFELLNSLFRASFISKESACNGGDGTGASGSIPGLGRSPGKGNGNPHQYSCLENPMDRGAWWATVHGVAVKFDLKTKHSRITHLISSKDEGNWLNHTFLILFSSYS